MTSVVTSYALPEEVVRYCEQHDLLGHLETALRLAEEYFHPIERLEAEVQPDPEVENEETVIIDIWVRLGIEESIKRKAAWGRRWVESIPPSVIGQIVLLHHVID